MDRTIRITGKAKLSVLPDTTELTVHAEGVYPEYEEAVTESAEGTALLREAVSRAGADPEGLKTVSFGVAPEYESYSDERNNWKQRFAGYRYRHAMRLRFPNDNALLGRLLQEISRCPVGAEFSIGYTVKDQEAVKNDLLGRAVADAREKAAALTAAAGVALGDLLTIDYSWKDIALRAESVAMLKRDMGAGEAFHDINLRPEEIDIEDSVTVVWEIRDFGRA